MKKFFGIILMSAISFASPLLAEPSEREQWISGTATVIDGDSIKLDGTLVRLFGIDAPELTQLCYTGNIARACGEKSAVYLSDMIYGQRIRCRIDDMDAYERILGSCIWNGRNINEVMVLTGNAVAWPAHTNFYIETEKTAEHNQSGIWATDFVRPDAWRLADDAAQKNPARRIDIHPSAGGGSSRKAPVFSNH